MRPTTALEPTARRYAARPMTGARVAVWLSAGALGVALGLNLGLPLPHPDYASRGMAQSNQAEVAVLLFPDLGGDGAFAPDCAGCDGLFESGDLLFAQRDPLPRIDVTLSDATGSSLTMRTRTLAPGRQQTLFRVDAPGSFTVTLAALPTEWQLCPHAPQDLRVDAADFGSMSTRATILIPLTHGCRRADATATADGTPVAESTAQPDATAQPPTEPAGIATPTALPDDDGGSTAGTDRADSGAEASAAAPASAVDAPLASGAAADVALYLPQTGLSRRTPLGSPIGLALLALVAAVLGTGGRLLHRRHLPQRSGRWPRRMR